MKKPKSKATTQTGKIPSNVGFPKVMYGVTRQLTEQELQQQKDLQK